MAVLYMIFLGEQNLYHCPLKKKSIIVKLKDFTFLRQ